MAAIRVLSLLLQFTHVEVFQPVEVGYGVAEQLVGALDGDVGLARPALAAGGRGRTAAAEAGG